MEKNDFVFTTPMSFVATSNSILYTGAQPVFIDIDEKTGNICTVKLEKEIKKFNKKGKKIKALIAIDYGGCPADWPKIRSLTKKNNIILINDGCHAIGSSIKNDTCYAIKYADFVTYSFHPAKQITTGEGGAVLTNNKNFDKRIKTLRSHGIIKDEKNFFGVKIWLNSGLIID